MTNWLEQSIFYEIYPQSFRDTNGDGIGDLPGIIEKLDYIQALGCNALWLNPCFDSPFGDAGYDVADYCRVAPRYGTNEDLVRLFDEAHRRGMHVLLDLVPGHTSIEHPWFKASMQPEQPRLGERGRLRQHQRPAAGHQPAQRLRGGELLLAAAGAELRLC